MTVIKDDLWSWPSGYKEVWMFVSLLTFYAHNDARPLLSWEKVQPKGLPSSPQRTRGWTRALARHAILIKIAVRLRRESRRHRT
jgi:hypothetical protein